MILFGAPGIAMAHLGTVLGLCMAFGVGYWVAPLLGFSRTLLADSLPQSIRIVLLKSEYSGKIISRGATFLRHYPSILLADLLNLPGNSLLGGGGGIAMLFGFARAMSWPTFALTIAAATAPAPTLFLVTSPDIS